MVGIIKGRRLPEECVYVDAHYDHWGKAGGKLQPGANDNASGVAVILEIAKAVSKLGLDRSVVFLASDFEEGSAFPYGGGIKGTAYHAEHPYCPAGKIKAAVVLDMVGGRFVDGVAPQLILLGSESSRATYDLAKSLAANPAKAVPLRQLGIYGIEPAGPSLRASRELGDKAGSVEKLQRDRRYLVDNLRRWSPKNRRIAVRRTVQNAVVDLMKMNGALKLWDHLYRRH